MNLLTVGHESSQVELVGRLDKDLNMPLNWPGNSWDPAEAVHNETDSSGLLPIFL